MELETVLYEVSDGVATVTLNRPQAMNAWTAQLADDLARAMGAADSDESVRAVVVTGAGRAFCAGADLSGGEGGFAPGDKRADASPRLMPHKVRKPVIAAINGHAVGVGITYPMLCDIRIAANEAKIQFAMVRRGILPELGSHVILPRVVGFSLAAELLLTGKLMTGAEAAFLGLVSRSLPAAEVLPAALEMARDIAVNVAPVSAALSKKMLWEGITSGLDEMIATEGRIIADMATSADAAEGVRAFFEKRAPQWSMTLADDLARFAN
ncbi:MAG: enoyl-CoA hydratase-related protein [Ilumatobacteraceae bacterium]